MTSTTIVLFLLLTSIVILLSSTSSQTLPPYSGFQGEWRLLQTSIGISAMHMQLLATDEVIIFDRTDFGQSNLSLPGRRCRYDPNDTVLRVDCTAHSILYHVNTNTFWPLMVQTDTWCSSGSVLPNGTLVQTGGYNDGDHVIRTFTPCLDGTCDWVEFPNYLSQRRWYATNQILPEGRIIVIGGRRQFNYEFFPHSSNYASSSQNFFSFRFLRETTDQSENNLYPFVHLLPDGNLFIFANTRSILLDYTQNHVIKEFPRIPGGDPRNYPSSGSSVLLPLDENKASIEAEIMVCGGAPQDSFSSASQGTFTSAVHTCGRLQVGAQNPNWIMEDMPIPRVMGDMLLLPTGDIILINGAGLGTAGWERGRAPVLTPVIYRPTEHFVGRFLVMSPSSRPRLYHSSAILLRDGRVLVGGNNPHTNYNFTNVEYPTDLSLEAFSPPYLSDEYNLVRPSILSTNGIVRYKEVFWVTFTVPEYLSVNVLSVRIIMPPFTTHSFGMNQRMVVLKLIGVTRLTPDSYYVTVVGPSKAEVAPPGYYMLFMVHAGIPSSGTWVNVQ
ncbi:glyoxal oxidase-related protein [Quillaja saponaria]|uniref:Glyoxal oxidase-related protein n=1 Tax=Quillaja saponaria TaxID=32244 RepID=A0AAD7VJC5_QUISA|nr:glyoxal oxidase-related protein [Quillaja saponaria]